MLLSTASRLHSSVTLHLYLAAHCAARDRSFSELFPPHRWLLSDNAALTYPHILLPRAGRHASGRGAKGPVRECAGDRARQGLARNVFFLYSDVPWGLNHMW